MPGSDAATLYLYGFVPATSPDPPADLLGIDDAPVESISFEGFRACVSRVDGTTYRDPDLSERLEDLSWVGRRGLEHERVVTWFVDQDGIVPTRLFTLFSSRGALERNVTERTERVARLLAEFADLHEWHLKITFDPAAMAPHLGEESPEIRRLDEEISAAAAGRAYLLERKRADLAERQATEIAHRLSGELRDELDDVARAVRVLPPPERTAARRLALNAAVLVEREREPALRDRAARGGERLERLGLEVAFSGPWAPYRFLPDEDEIAGASRGEDAG